MPHPAFEQPATKREKPLLRAPTAIVGASSCFAACLTYNTTPNYNKYSGDNVSAWRQ